VARKYNLWLHFFHEKRKKQFIPLPWNIGEFIFININKIDEFANRFNNVSLKYVENIKGFDPKKNFVGHMLLVGFSNSFSQTILNKEEEGNIQRKHYLEVMIFTSKGEKVQVKEVLNIQLSLLRILPLGAVLQ